MRSQSYDQEKNKAIELRSRGYSLTNIVSQLKTVPRSTVYYWISKTPLTPNQREALEEKRKKGRIKGSHIRNMRRLATTKTIVMQAIKEIGHIDRRSLFLLGIALYWGEGTKQTVKCISQPVSFTNSDPRMISVFNKWLDAMGVSENERNYTLYIHQQYKYRERYIKKSWKKYLKREIKKWQTTIYKNNATNHQIENEYLGLLRVTIKKSVYFNRRISGWIEGVSRAVKKYNTEV